MSQEHLMVTSVTISTFEQVGWMTLLPGCSHLSCAWATRVLTAFVNLDIHIMVNQVSPRCWWVLFLILFLELSSTVRMCLFPESWQFCSHSWVMIWTNALFRSNEWSINYKSLFTPRKGPCRWHIIIITFACINSVRVVLMEHVLQTPVYTHEQIQKGYWAGPRFHCY